MHAVDAGEIGILNYLVVHGADLHARAHNGRNALSLAASRGHVQVLFPAVDRATFLLDFTDMRSAVGALAWFLPNGKTAESGSGPQERHGAVPSRPLLALWGGNDR